MRDNLSIFIIMIVLVILAVIFPLYNNFQRQDDMSYNLVLKATTNFVDEIINCGYISQEMYDNYVNNIANTGNLYDIELEAHKKVLIKSDKSDKYEEQYFIDYNYEIFDFSENTSISGAESSNLDKRILKGGTYYLNVDDEIYVKVKNSSTTMAGAIFNLIVPTATQDTIKINYGGKVKNNAWLQADVYDKQGVSLIFDLNGGYNTVATMTQQMFNGETAVKFNIPKNEPSKGGAKFLGWSEDKNATSPKYKYNGGEGLRSSIEITDDTVLYAVWYMPSKPSVPTISVRKVSFNAAVQNGDWSNEPISVTISATLKENEKIQYSLNGGSNWIDYTGLITLGNDKDINQTLRARVTNTVVSSIKSSEVTFQIKVDKHKPSIPTNLSCDSTETRLYNFRGSGSNDPTFDSVQSGISKYVYCDTSNGNYKDSLDLNSLYANTPYTIYVKAVDTAGNSSDAKGFSIRTKDITQKVQFTYDSKPTYGPLQVTISHPNIPSGYTLQYKLNNGDWVPINNYTQITITKNNTKITGRLVKNPNTLSQDERAVDSVTINNIETRKVYLLENASSDGPAIYINNVDLTGCTRLHVDLYAMDIWDDGEDGGSATVGILLSEDMSNWWDEDYDYRERFKLEYYNNSESYHKKVLKYDYGISYDSEYHIEMDIPLIDVNGQSVTGVHSYRVTPTGDTFWNCTVYAY